MLISPGTGKGIIRYQVPKKTNKLETVTWFQTVIIRVAQTDFSEQY